MKKLLLVCCFIPWLANADVTVNLIEDKIYTDLDLTEVSRKKNKEKFKLLVEKYLNKHLVKTGHSEKQIELDFKEVDMAGRVDKFRKMGIMADMRVIDQMDVSYLEFSFTIKKGTEVIKQGDKVLKDVGTIKTARDRMRKNRHQALYFELRLLKNWLDEIL
jgi:DNA polymerase/3'-5' exonuclease PolX